MEVVSKSRSVRQMVARTGLRCGSVVTPTVSTEIRASDQIVQFGFAADCYCIFWVK